MSFNSLSGYKPQKPAEGGGFEPFKYEGRVKVNYARVEEQEKTTEFSTAGDKILKMELECLDAPNAKRKLWKNYNLDNEKADKKGKTPIMKLADQLFALDLEFNDKESLENVLVAFASMTVLVKAWPAKFADKTIQMFNLKGVSPEAWEEDSSGQAAF